MYLCRCSNAKRCGYAADFVVTFMRHLAMHIWSFQQCLQRSEKCAVLSSSPIAWSFAYRSILLSLIQKHLHTIGANVYDLHSISVETSLLHVSQDHHYGRVILSRQRARAPASDATQRDPLRYHVTRRGYHGYSPVDERSLLASRYNLVSEPCFLNL